MDGTARRGTLHLAMLSATKRTGALLLLTSCSSIGEEHAAGGANPGASAGVGGTESAPGSPTDPPGTPVPEPPLACAVSPVDGQWFGHFWEDPFLLALERAATGVTGTLAIALPTDGEVISDYVGAIATSAASEGNLSFDTQVVGPSRIVAYQVFLDLTLSSDGRHLSGTFRLCEECSAFPALFVRVDPDEVAEAASCPAAVPAQCFDAPLAADSIRYTHSRELSDGDLVVLWENERGVEHRVAFARYDVDQGVWRGPRFLDDGAMPYGIAGVVANDQDTLVVALTSSDPTRFWLQRYDPQTDVWLAPESVNEVMGSRIEGFAVEADDSINLAWQGGDNIVAGRYDAGTERWQAPQVVGEAQLYNADFDYDASGNGVAIWGRTISAGVADEVWASFRTPAGQWGEAQLIDTSENQVLNPTVALDEQGRVIAAWELYNCAIRGVSSHLTTQQWGEVVDVVRDRVAESPSVWFAGGTTPTVLYSLFGGGLRRQASHLDFTTNLWSTPGPAEQADLSQASYWVQGTLAGLEVVSAIEEVPPIPSLLLGQCVTP